MYFLDKQAELRTELFAWFFLLTWAGVDVLLLFPNA